MLLQSGQRAQAGGVSLAGRQEIGPGTGQLKQPDGVAGRGGVEDDVLILPVGRVVGEQVGELIKRGDLRGA